MKKKMAMTVMTLAVSAMAGSAFAANEPAKTTGSSAPLKMVNTDGTEALLKPIISLEQMAKEKGISVEDLIEQLKEEGTLAMIASTTTINPEEVAKEKGISVEELIKQLEKEGTIATSEAASFTHPSISLEQMAKEMGISVEELIKQLEKEDKITKGTTVSVPAIKK